MIHWPPFAPASGWERQSPPPPESYRRPPCHSYSLRVSRSPQRKRDTRWALSEEIPAQRLPPIPATGAADSKPLERQGPRTAMRKHLPDRRREEMPSISLTWRTIHMIWAVVSPLPTPHGWRRRSDHCRQRHRQSASASGSKEWLTGGK